MRCPLPRQLKTNLVYYVAVTINPIVAMILLISGAVLQTLKAQNDVEFPKLVDNLEVMSPILLGYNSARISRSVLVMWLIIINLLRGGSSRKFLGGAGPWKVWIVKRQKIQNK